MHAKLIESDEVYAGLGNTSKVQNGNDIIGIINRLHDLHRLFTPLTVFHSLLCLDIQISHYCREVVRLVSALLYSAMAGIISSIPTVDLNDGTSVPVVSVGRMPSNRRTI